MAVKFWNEGCGFVVGEPGDSTWRHLEFEIDPGEQLLMITNGEAYESVWASLTVENLEELIDRLTHLKNIMKEDADARVD